MDISGRRRERRGERERSLVVPGPGRERGVTAMGTSFLPGVVRMF